MKNSSKTAGNKSGGLMRVQEPQLIGRLGRIREAHVRKRDQKNPTFLQKLKELAAEVEDNKDIVSNIYPQDDSDNRN